MNRKDIEDVMYLSADGKLTRKDVHEMLNTLLDRIEESVADGETVSIVGFGSFVLRERAERTGRNPQTGEAIKIPARKAVGFKVGKGFRDRVND